MRTLKCFSLFEEEASHIVPKSMLTTIVGGFVRFTGLALVGVFPVFAATADLLAGLALAGLAELAAGRLRLGVMGKLGWYSDGSW